MIQLTCIAGGQHAEGMLELIDRAVTLAGFSPKETNLVACAEGPGSFTGLRLAFSAAKAIQLAAECPLFPVPPLPVYAEMAKSWPGVVISVLDAKKQRFYAQFFRRGASVTEALDIGAKEAAAYIDPSERILVTGPDANLFGDELSASVPGLDLTVIPSGTEGIASAMISFAKKQNAHYTNPVPDHAGPVYVRKSDAEANNA
jgi:tRNA threonylcarbamoyladenosine biosynthesis protein TsaB